MKKDMIYKPRQGQRDILDRAMGHIESVPYKVTARWLFYRLLQDSMFRGKDDYHAKFLPLTAKARKCFFEGWSPETLADDTRELVPGGNGYDSAMDWLSAVQRGLECNLTKWCDQDYYVEVWFEAAAMVGQFRYHTKELPLLAFHGDISIPQKWETAKRLEDASAAYGLPIVVLYFGDDDPKGHSIPMSALADIWEWCGVPFEFVRCALNEGDGVRFGIPENPEKPNCYQWEALSDEQAGGLIASFVGHYYDLDRLAGIEADEARITAKFRHEFQGLINNWDDKNDGG